MMFFAYLNQLLSTYCGAAVVTVCVQVWGEGGGGGGAVAAAVRGWRYGPAVAAPLLLVLGLLATAATTARNTVARTLLIVYGVVSVVCSCLALSMAAWSSVELWAWLREEGTGRELARDDKLLLWLRPLLPLFAPDHINTMFAESEMRWEVVAALCCGAALLPLVLVGGIAALCSLPPTYHRDRNISGSSRSNSLHYESTSVYKIPLNDSAVW